MLIKKRVIFVWAGIIIAAVTILAVRFLWTLNTIQIENASLFEKVSNYIRSGGVKPGLLPIDKEYEMPKKEETRFDLLFLGIRGEDPLNPDEGNYLADSIMIFSYDSLNQKSAIISIPRDLYIKIPKTNKPEKINTAYVLGLERKKPISYPKALISKITGVYIDKVVAADFKAFAELVNAIGGIEIYLDKPFSESKQWGYEFYLPSGKNILNGEQALYYVRSRYSTSDFDRSRRQQEVIIALKNKLTSLGLLKDPVKINEIIKIVERNIKTDIGILDIPKLINIANILSAGEKIDRYVISTENLVYESHLNGFYVLLPKGDSLEEIKKLFQEIIK